MNFPHHQIDAILANPDATPEELRAALTEAKRQIAGYRALADHAGRHPEARCYLVQAGPGYAGTHIWAPTDEEEGTIGRLISGMLWGRAVQMHDEEPARLAALEQARQEGATAVGGTLLAAVALECGKEAATRVFERCRGGSK